MSGRLLKLLIFLPCFSGRPMVQGEHTRKYITLCGHADTKPDAVAQWYHDRGYNFLILSEHNKFIDPSTVKLKGQPREDFPCAREEVTAMTAMNASRLVLAI